jgi:uncharacterized delta-60 repeat protein
MFFIRRPCIDASLIRIVKVIMNTSKSAGELDPEFGVDGLAFPNFPKTFANQVVDIAVTRDKKIVLLAELHPEIDDSAHHRAYGLCRLDEHGGEDRKFGNEGSLMRHFFRDQDASARGLGLFDDGRMLVYGISDTGSDIADRLKSCLICFLPDGQVDTHFGIAGISVIASAAFPRDEQPITSASQGSSGTIRVLPDNRTLVLLDPPFSPENERWMLRILSNGQPDESFANGQGYLAVKATPSLGAINVTGFVTQPDQKIVVYGKGTQSPRIPVLIRYDQNGLLDHSFGEAGYAYLPEQMMFLDAMVVQSDGRLIALGSYRSSNGMCGMLIKLLENGQPDDSFNAGEPVVSPLTPMPYRWMGGAILSNGELMVAGTMLVPLDNKLIVANYLETGLENRRFGKGAGFVLTSVPPAAFIFRRAALQDDTRFLCVATLHSGSNPVRSCVAGY